MKILFESKLHHIFWGFIDLIFPPNCAGCGSKGARWCNVCAGKVARPKQVCKLCGQLDVFTGVCSQCERQRPHYTAARSALIYQAEIRNAIHRLKYQKDLGLGVVLAEYLYEVVRVMEWHVDVIVPIALSPNRYRKRGYNQAVLLAQPLGWKLNVPVEIHGLRRVRETRSQVGLNYIERQENLAGAFDCGKIFVCKSVLLVDDVITSGATIKAATEALLKGGAASVYVTAVARVPLS